MTKVTTEPSTKRSIADRIKAANQETRRQAAAQFEGLVADLAAEKHVADPDIAAILAASGRAPEELEARLRAIEERGPQRESTASVPRLEDERVRAHEAKEQAAAALRRAETADGEAGDALHAASRRLDVARSDAERLAAVAPEDPLVLAYRERQRAQSAHELAKRRIRKLRELVDAGPPTPRGRPMPPGKPSTPAARADRKKLAALIEEDRRKLTAFKQTEQELKASTKRLPALEKEVAEATRRLQDVAKE